MKIWSFKKHIIVCLIFLLLPVAAWGILQISGRVSHASVQISNIGIIGGADGPTAIFISSGARDFEKIVILWVLSAIVLLFLYKPIKRMIERKNMIQ